MCRVHSTDEVGTITIPVLRMRKQAQKSQVLWVYAVSQEQSHKPHLNLSRDGTLYSPWCFAWFAGPWTGLKFYSTVRFSHTIKVANGDKRSFISCTFDFGSASIAIDPTQLSLHPGVRCPSNIFVAPLPTWLEAAFEFSTIYTKLLSDFI